MIKTETINIKKFWEMFAFPYNRPEKLSEQESLFISVKNQSYNEDWSLPEYVSGWLYAEAWFNNMVSGQPARRGATRLQYRTDMGLPVYLDGYNNSNHGASLWFIPQVYIGGNTDLNFRAEIELSGRRHPEFARLFVEKKK